MGDETDVGLKSKAVPGVFGVLLADPKEAKAPEPSPNADDAPGGAVLFVFRGVMLLERLEREVVSPLERRFKAPKGRA